jgi:excisionase family DNA binding protein
VEKLAMDECDGNGNKRLQPPHEEAVDSHTAAAFLGIHHKTLERMARKGLIPATKFGKSWQFLLSLLDEWRKKQMNSNLNKNQPPKKNEEKENEE